MVMTVFDSWGIHSSEDIGNMVFNLIGAGIFGKTEEDSIEDFRNVYRFRRGFREAVRTGKASGDEGTLGIAGAQAYWVEKVISSD